MFFIRDVCVYYHWEPCFASIFKATFNVKTLYPVHREQHFTIVPSINICETYDSHFANVSIIEGQFVIWTMFVSRSVPVGPKEKLQDYKFDS